ncbi:restriction endonuclease subunit S [Halarcobacter sp.]|uniref:restriction endonuclease subunit S n=1 Tax=Halarcobacter sp. TaxID=2321133 RepID=UPI003A949771
MQLKKLKDTCIIKPPKKEAKDLLTESDLVSFVPMSDLGIDQKFLRLNEEKELKKVYSGYTYFKDDDVLLAKITPCFENGKLGIAKKLKNGIGFGSSEYIVYRPKNKEELNSEYLYYFLNQESFREFGASRMAGAVGHKRIQKDFYEEYLIPIISIERQKQIVEILDKAFEAIDKAKDNIEKNIQNSKELFQSKINNYMYKKEELSNLVDITTGKLNSNEAVENGQYPFFTCSKDIFKINKFSFDCEAILLAGNNAVGNFNVKHYKGKFDAYQRTYVITVKDNVELDYRFLYFQMLSSLADLKSQSVGAGTKFLRLPIIKSFKIYYPSIDEQKKFVNEIDHLLEQTGQLEEKYQQKLKNLEELKKSILQKAFSGELI